ncbi:bis(5'-nucleosyl)-tetraphosphatase [asymmetrical]-like [Convolutriloba macropyga]|uniref:bis(5'-nucleosyl)-tetraphosphatase [asymmetrical]-like n=1 Tax=Convolutriloba macropyga TaxID=536237 RepID=UPI003F5241F1
MSVKERAFGFILFRWKHGTAKVPEFLLLKANEGHWSPPKGHPEKEESELESAYRETEEEAGYKKEQLKVYQQFERSLFYEVRSRTRPGETVLKESKYWLARLLNSSDPVVISDEHTQFVWEEVANAVKTVKFTDLGGLLTESFDFISKLEE